MAFAYAVRLEEEDGIHLVSVRDLPEVVTSGESLAEALAMAADAIEVAVAGRMLDGDDIPSPSPAAPGEHVVPVPLAIAPKALLYVAWRKSGLTKVALAARIGRQEKEVRRLLDPRLATSLRLVEEAAAALGFSYSVSAIQAAEQAESVAAEEASQRAG